ncbi:hypothetical protein HYH03_007385 [Edaphochlamys debaryana]|uniref:Uncharacterized protein n=1 Tax=Edaphochlamys debaryana TaxID=47281 RepID=A0A835Y0C8_9CHLO|nr:hypothetical protein HYH03_007385 [Edaphochlamys debaryana]|eukprot:KAG2494327.1 hypothetical protein HYH03_007385 [Edaphochlamys debaryana]
MATTPDPRTATPGPSEGRVFCGTARLRYGALKPTVVVVKEAFPEQCRMTLADPSLNAHDVILRLGPTGRAAEVRLARYRRHAKNCGSAYTGWHINSIGNLQLPRGTESVELWRDGTSGDVFVVPRAPQTAGPAGGADELTSDDGDDEDTASSGSDYSDSEEETEDTDSLSPGEEESEGQEQVEEAAASRRQRPGPGADAEARRMPAGGGCVGDLRCSKALTPSDLDRMALPLAMVREGGVFHAFYQDMRGSSMQLSFFFGPEDEDCCVRLDFVAKKDRQALRLRTFSRLSQPLGLVEGDWLLFKTHIGGDPTHFDVEGWRPGPGGRWQRLSPGAEAAVAPQVERVPLRAQPSSAGSSDDDVPLARRRKASSGSLAGGSKAVGPTGRQPLLAVRRQQGSSGAPVRQPVAPTARTLGTEAAGGTRATGVILSPSGGRAPKPPPSGRPTLPGTMRPHSGGGQGTGPLVRPLGPRSLSAATGSGPGPGCADRRQLAAPASAQLPSGGAAAAPSAELGMQAFNISITVSARMLRGGYLRVHSAFATDAGLEGALTRVRLRDAGSVVRGGASGSAGSVEASLSNAPAPDGQAVCQLLGLGGWMAACGVVEGTVIRIKFFPPGDFTIAISEPSPQPRAQLSAPPDPTWQLRGDPDRGEPPRRLQVDGQAADVEDEVDDSGRTTERQPKASALGASKPSAIGGGGALHGSAPPPERRAAKEARAAIEAYGAASHPPPSTLPASPRGQLRAKLSGGAPTAPPVLMSALRLAAAKPAHERGSVADGSQAAEQSHPGAPASSAPATSASSSIHIRVCASILDPRQKYYYIRVSQAVASFFGVSDPSTAKHRTRVSLSVRPAGDGTGAGGGGSAKPLEGVRLVARAGRGVSTYWVLWGLRPWLLAQGAQAGDAVLFTRRLPPGQGPDGGGGHFTVQLERQPQPRQAAQGPVGAGGDGPVNALDPRAAAPDARGLSDAEPAAGMPRPAKASAAADRAAPQRLPAAASPRARLWYGFTRSHAAQLASLQRSSGSPEAQQRFQGGGGGGAGAEAQPPVHGPAGASAGAAGPSGAPESSAPGSSVAGHAAGVLRSAKAINLADQAEPQRLPNEAPAPKQHTNPHPQLWDDGVGALWLACPVAHRSPTTTGGAACTSGAAAPKPPAPHQQQIETAAASNAVAPAGGACAGVARSSGRAQASAGSAGLPTAQLPASIIGHDAAPPAICLPDGLTGPPMATGAAVSRVPSVTLAAQQRPPLSAPPPVPAASPGQAQPPHHCAGAFGGGAGGSRPSMVRLPTFAQPTSPLNAPAILPARLQPAPPAASCRPPLASTRAQQGMDRPVGAPQRQQASPAQPEAGAAFARDSAAAAPSAGKAPVPDGTPPVAAPLARTAPERLQNREGTRELVAAGLRGAQYATQHLRAGPSAVSASGRGGRFYGGSGRFARGRGRGGRFGGTAPSRPPQQDAATSGEGTGATVGWTGTVAGINAPNASCAAPPVKRPKLTDGGTGASASPQQPPSAVMAAEAARPSSPPLAGAHIGPGIKVEPGPEQAPGPLWPCGMGLPVGAEPDSNGTSPAPAPALPQITLEPEPQRADAPTQPEDSPSHGTSPLQPQPPASRQPVTALAHPAAVVTGARSVPAAISAPPPLAAQPVTELQPRGGEDEEPPTVAVACARPVTDEALLPPTVQQPVAVQPSGGNEDEEVILVEVRSAAKAPGCDGLPSAPQHPAAVQTQQPGLAPTHGVGSAEPLAASAPLHMSAANLPASSVAHLHGCLPPGVPLPPLQPGELRLCGLTFHPDLAPSVRRAMQEWEASGSGGGGRLAALDPATRQISIPGVDGDAGGSAAALAASTAFSRHGLRRPILATRLARHLGIYTHWDAPLPSGPLPLSADLVAPGPEPELGGAGLFARAAIKPSWVLGVVGGYAMPRAAAEAFAARGLRQSQHLQAAMTDRAGGNAEDADSAWGFLAGSFRLRLPGLGPSPCGAGGCELSMLGYGNEAALVNDPRRNPRAWAPGNDVGDEQGAAAKVNCMVLRVSVRGLVLPVLLALRDIAPGEQLLRDYGAEWWRGLAEAWEVVEDLDLRPSGLLHGAVQASPSPPSVLPPTAAAPPEAPDGTGSGGNGSTQQPLGLPAGPTSGSSAPHQGGGLNPTVPTDAGPPGPVTERPAAEPEPKPQAAQQRESDAPPPWVSWAQLQPRAGHSGDPGTARRGGTAPAEPPSQSDAPGP